MHDELSNLVRGGGVKPFLVDHLPADFGPRLLVELIDRTAYRFELRFADATRRHHRVKELAMRELHHDVADIELLQHLARHGDDFGVRDHDSVVSGDVEVALEELAVAPLERE